MDSEKRKFLESLSDDEKHNVFFDQDLVDFSVEDVLLGNDPIRERKFIFIKNEKMFDIVQKVLDLELFPSPWKGNRWEDCPKRIGFYEWDFEYDRWISMDCWPEVEQECYRLTGVDA